MDSILQEVNAILEKDIEEKLPDIPFETHAESNTKTSVYDSKLDSVLVSKTINLVH